MRNQVEDVFLDWKQGLSVEDQEQVHYEEFDQKLQIVFVNRLSLFDKALLMGLEQQLQDKISPTLLVSSLTKESF